MSNQTENGKNQKGKKQPPLKFAVGFNGSDNFTDLGHDILHRLF